jgi:hypothetical protein
MFSPLVTLTFLLPLLAQQAQAGLFAKDSQVKMLDQKLFKKAMAQNRTAVVAFVAPWCGVSPLPLTLLPFSFSNNCAWSSIVNE